MTLDGVHSTFVSAALFVQRELRRVVSNRAMSQFSMDAYSDGGDADADADVAEAASPIHGGSIRANRPAPSASHDEVPLYVLRGIRTAAAGSASLPPVPGYSPRMSIDMACAYSWAPYSAVTPTTRSLSIQYLKDEHSRGVARAAIAELYNHATPFDAGRLFPAGEVYVCLDRAPFASYIQSIQRYVAMAEATQYGNNFSKACDGYMTGMSSAIDVLTRERDDGYHPVLYDREAFESVFLLTWVQP